MTTEHVIQFFTQQPFVPFTLCLVNGRELQVQHPETATLGRAGLAVYFFTRVGRSNLSTPPLSSRSAPFTPRTLTN